jgi:hypothetical protein
VGTPSFEDQLEGAKGEIETLRAQLAEAERRLGEGKARL